MLPNFLFIGAEKSGTTWFYRRLKEHPDIYLPETKEVHFFNKYDSNLTERNHYARFDLRWYEDFFRFCDGERAVGEVTPMYLCDPCAPERIKAALPEVKLICCLRNPVDRAYSHYWMARRKRHTHLSFEEVIECEEARFIERGDYYEQLYTYLEQFSREQLLILIHEEVFREPAEHLQKVCHFLEVDPAFYRRDGDANLREEENRAGGYHSLWLYDAIGKTAKLMREHYLTGRLLDALKATGMTDEILEVNRKPQDYPPMQPAHRKYLRDYYASSMKELEALLGRRVAVWD